MPVPPIDAFEHPPNPFIIEQSKLLKAATSLSRPETSREKQAAKGPIDSSQHFVISTRQIIALIARFKMRAFTYDELVKFPLSLLKPEEKDFINYLRRNKQVFDRIANLDHEPGSISVDDIKIAARLAGDTLVLSDEDLEYLKEAPIQKPEPLDEEEEEIIRRPSKKLQTQDLIDAVQKLNPKGMRFEELMALDIEQARLRGRARRSMEFLQSSTVSKVLEKVVQPYNGVLTPEALRVLTSLLWNPAIYGAAPVVFFRMAPMAHEADIEPLTALKTVDSVDDHKHNIRSRRQKPTFRLEAHHIMNICHRLSPGDGRVSLKQLRKYKPHNLDEEKALNLLRQGNIFRALANLDHDPDSLSDDDIQLALAEGNIVLSDPYMILVIQP